MASFGRFLDTAVLPAVPISSIPLATVLPTLAPRFSLRVSSRELASFARSIPPRFVLSCNPQSTKSGVNWLRSGAIRHCCAGRRPRLFNSTGRRPLFFGSTPYASRHSARTSGFRPGTRNSPAGYCLTPTAELVKAERGPIATNEPSILSMSPNRAIRPVKIKIENPLISNCLPATRSAGRLETRELVGERIAQNADSCPSHFFGAGSFS